MTRLGGPDVSHYQGAIDWHDVRAKDFELAFVIAKASEGEGLGDQLFTHNWHSARAAGLLRGAYHFARPAAGEGVEAQATRQAQRFAAVLESVGGIHPGDLPPALDLESSDGVLGAALETWVGTWVDTVHHLVGRWPLIYTNDFWDSAMPTRVSSFGCPLWIASWGTREPALPRGWDRWTFWQQTQTGRLTGINSAVDLNVFNGSRAALDALAHGDGRHPHHPDHRHHVPPPPPHHEPPAHPAWPPPWPGRALAEGSRGAAVRTWQEGLRERGFTALAADGAFGPLTREACRWLQLYLEVEPTGTVDERTWSATWTAP